MIERSRILERRAMAMTVVVVLQSIAAMFFVVDAAGDVARSGLGAHLVSELAAAAALLVGVLWGAWLIRTLVQRARQDALAVAAARGVVTELIRLRFAEWQLTPAETEVALFALKGCDVQDIAKLRGSAAGTVRAQLANIYGKAGVNSLPALLALFLDELIDIGTVRAAA